MMTGVTRNPRTLVLLVPMLAGAGCGGERSGPEEQIRAWVDARHLAAEDKDRSGVMDGISTAYADARGNTHSGIEDMLRYYFLRQGSISLLVSIDSINVIADTAAEVSLTVGMAGTDGSALGFSADAYNFELELEADGDNWQLISARWGEIGQQLR